MYLFYFFKKSLLNLLQYCFYVLVFWLGGKWDLSSLTRDWTHTQCTGSQTVDHWITREIPPCTFPLLYPGIHRVPKNLIWFLCMAMTIDNTEGLHVCTLKALWPQQCISLFWSSDFAERLSLGLQDWVSELGLSMIKRCGWEELHG